MHNPKNVELIVKIYAKQSYITQCQIGEKVRIHLKSFEQEVDGWTGKWLYKKVTGKGLKVIKWR